MRKFLIITAIALISIIVVASLFTNIAGSIYEFYKKITVGEFMMEKFATYTPKSEGLDFAFSYPQVWKVSESKGRTERYSQIHILGPSNIEKTMKVSITLTAYSIEGLKKYSGLERYCDEYISKREKLKNFKLLNKIHKAFKDISVIHIDISYDARLPLYSANAKDVSIESKAILFERNGCLYDFAYQNDKGGFKRYYPIFEKVLQSLKFKQR